MSISTGIEGEKIIKNMFIVNDKHGATGYDKEALAAVTEEQRAILKKDMGFEATFSASYRNKVAFYNDFENYQHGIMSAFLLCKNLRAFQDIDYDMHRDKIYTDGIHQARSRQLAVQLILSSISNHTNDCYSIRVLGRDSFLTFVDELEEFSRISRASQNREYVEEFCDTALFMEDDWLNIVFEFNNTNLDNLDPERAFKGRCKRFLSLFDICTLSSSLKLRVKVVGKLPIDENTYVLEIARKHVDVLINGESQNIPKYLKSTQFYTKEEYAQM